MRKQINKSIGRNINELLYQQRKKQVWLARECGVTPSHICQIIKGKVKPSYSLLEKLALVLKVPICELVGDVDE